MGLDRALFSDDTVGKWILHHAASPTLSFQPSTLTFFFPACNSDIVSRWTGESCESGVPLRQWQWLVGQVGGPLSLLGRLALIITVF